MSAGRFMNEELNFLETCVELELLSQAEATSLKSVINENLGSISQEAVRRGLLTPSDIDIVQSLQRPLSVIPEYEILGFVGRGGMGVVYRARQMDLDRIVALKTILINSVSNTTVAARFEREAKSLARLQHPNIVQALNFGKHQGRYYFAMEFVPGRSCEQVVREEGRMVDSRVWLIVRQVAAGLLHALHQNLIHRDIKPANLILVPPPEGSPSGAEIVKIADFGLAMFADHSPDQLKLTTGDKIMGSPVYMSPEQFGGGSIDFRTDMYAIGATAWHLLFGSPPFEGNNLATLVHKKSMPFAVNLEALPVRIPEDQMRLLVGMLNPDASGRPQSYEHLIEAIDQIMSNAPTSKTSPQVREPGMKPIAAISDQPTHDAISLASDVGIAERLSADTSASRREITAPTVELNRSPQRMPLRRWRWLILVAILGGIVTVIGLMQFGSSSRGPRAYRRVASTTPLFDGVTLSGWDVGGSMVGAWNTVEAPDSSTAIACVTQQGALTRQIPDAEHPRVSLFVWMLKDSGSIDIDFAFDPVDPTGVRGCLRMSESKNQLGVKATDFGELDVAAHSEIPPSTYQRYHVVHIERQPSDWYVFLEEELIGTLPIDRIGSGNAIRLVVHRSEVRDVEPPTAFFADMQRDELRP